MQLIAHLAFDGNCSEAFDFYREVFDGEIVFRMTVGESPMAGQMRPESHGGIMHVHLVAGGASLMGADMQPGCGTGATTATPGSNWVNAMFDTVEEAERAWARLSQGANVFMPLEPTFWATRFGMLTDRFGQPWMVNGPAAEGVSP